MNNLLSQIDSLFVEIKKMKEERKEEVMLAEYESKKKKHKIKNETDKEEKTLKNAKPVSLELSGIFSQLRTKIVYNFIRSHFDFYRN